MLHVFETFLQSLKCQVAKSLAKLYLARSKVNQIESNVNYVLRTISAAQSTAAAGNVEREQNHTLIQAEAQKC